MKWRCTSSIPSYGEVGLQEIVYELRDIETTYGKNVRDVFATKEDEGVTCCSALGFNADQLNSLLVQKGSGGPKPSA